jgi:hypothetical protein
MPWYYAGPEAKPVGPVSVEELYARHLSGIISSETYVIEHGDRPIENWSWKRYREVFPTNLPPAPPHPVAPPVPTASPPAAAHPLFPSAAPVPHPVFPPGARPDPYYNVKPTNACCAWGFGLGLASFFFSFACGIGLLPAVIAFPLSIVGLAQVHKRREQSGQGLAIAGLVLSGLALLLALIIILSFVTKFKMHDFTVTEQTSSDSE